MSNAFGIAAVTAVMRDILSRRLVAAKAGGVVSAMAKVTAQPPDRIAVENGAESCLNLFLYEVAPNTGWAMEDHPSRGFDGRSVSNPMLALDLQYLLSAYGIEDMEAEVLLGHGMQALHESPGLSRAAIRKVLDPGPADGIGVLKKAFRERTVSLADQFESIKISPRYLKSDEMNKIWSSLNAHYRPSVVYQATVVLIESNARVRTPQPVLMRGTDDRGAFVQPSLLPPFPTLLAVRVAGGQPAARPDGKITLYGHHLAGTNVVVHFENPRLGIALTATGAALTAGPPNLGPDDFAADPALQFADMRIEVDLAQALPANTWAAGAFRVQVEVTRPGEAAPRSSNTLSVAIAPAFATAGPDKPLVVKGNNNSVSITLTCTPAIQPRQTASLVLGDQELAGPEFAAVTPKPMFKGVLPAAMLAPGTSHLARLRVDGVESLYIKHNPAPQPPEFDPAQRITMP